MDYLNADMAATTEKKTYPRLPAKNWWTLRERFRPTMPSRVDADYLQSVLGLTSTASAGNLMGPLRTMGLIDEKGAPTDRALDWRHDETYKDVCEAIVTEVYSESLRSAFPSPSTESTAVATWFARNTGSGRGAATGMAALYILLASGELDAKPSGTPAAPAKVARKATAKGVQQTRNEEQKDISDAPPRRDVPSVNINVEVHISSDASADQIDQIFKSMGVHLYGGR